MSLRLIFAITLVAGGGVAVGLVQAAQTLDTPPELLEYSPLSDQDLGVERARGAHDIINVDELNLQLNDIKQNANLDHNVIYSSNTGSNSLSGDAFAGSTGFATVIQNSGNNVIIQNATIVNLSLQK